MTRYVALVAVCVCLLSTATPADELAVRLDDATGLPAQWSTGRDAVKRDWLAGPVVAQVQRLGGKPVPLAAAPLAALGLQVAHRWDGSGPVRTWTLTFTGAGPRAEHSVQIDLPILEPGMKLFTPSDRGVMSVDAHPAHRPLPYGTIGWGNGQAYVLPLISLLAPKDDLALTIAMPADDNIPHLQFEWMEGKTLRLTMGHRGMGGGKPTQIRLMLLAHAADYRAAVGAYAGQFPEHFNPPVPRGTAEGTFWYHHIHDHPDLAEMARQKVRYIWSSFWFTYLGEYLPDENEWHPYTYAKWWKLGQTMSDGKINAFVRKMRDNGIGTYAYFNVTEYGGDGGKGGDAAEAARALKQRFANALMKNASGKDIPTWEGAMAMNPGPNYALWPFLTEQVRRHLARLPDIEGFVIDRLDWASTIDYGHDDGLTMVGGKPAENMAQPVGQAVREVCRLAHEKGKRVFVNQFYRIEVLRDTDGTCHENDYLPALGYLTPLRPAAAWHHRKPYTGDLLQFEAHLKRRLHWKLFPQMIAHSFPISQQGPNPKAADLLELAAPLFDRLAGCRQVLQPHCVSASGPCEANLYSDPKGNLVVPLTSRVSFLSRSGAPPAGGAVVNIRNMGHDARWAHVYPLGGRPYKAQLVGVMERPTQGPSRAETVMTVRLERHEPACVVVVGHGQEPPLDDKDAPRLIELREKLFGKAEPVPSAEPPPKPDLAGLTSPAIRISGEHLGAAGPIDVFLGEVKVGTFSAASCTLPLPALPEGDLRVGLRRGDEGIWLLPRRIDLLARRGEQSVRVASWTPYLGFAGDSDRLDLFMQWTRPESVAAGLVRFEGRDTETAGRWAGKYGSVAAWIPNVQAGPQKGYRLDVVAGQPFTWPGGQKDPRSLQAADGRGEAAATCWHDMEKVSLAVTPPDAKPYRLTVYLLDYDRNKRAMSVEFEGAAPAQRAEIAETDKGAYLTWTVSGELQIDVRKHAGYNAVLSGVFVDQAK